MVCFQSYVPQSMVKRDLFWGFFVPIIFLPSGK